MVVLDLEAVFIRLRALWRLIVTGIRNLPFTKMVLRFQEVPHV